MLDKAKSIDESLLKKLNDSYDSNPFNKAIHNALSVTSLSNIINVQEEKRKLRNHFSIDIETMSATNQKNSGRCWIFAGMNVLREIVKKKLNLEEFELSQNFIAYYDKLEKINYALESIIDLLDAPDDDRTLRHVLYFGVGDGGQWDMLKSIIKKYGVVPKEAMDETYASSNTWESSFIIDRSIRKFAAEAKRLYKQKKYNEIRLLKDQVLEDLHKVITLCFGKPVEKFDFEYVDKDKKYGIDKDLTPKSFFEKYIGIDIDDYVSIINSPTKDKPFYETFTVDYLGNVIGGDPIHYLNLPMSELKELTVKQLKDKEVVWFGSDCGMFGTEKEGYWAPELFDYKSSLGIDISMDKADMLDYCDSAMNHAMVISGVNLDNDNPTKWKIENSWGKKEGIDGYYTASDKWFDLFVYQVVINKKYLNDKQLKALEKEPKHLHPWDPMGTLA